MLIGPLPDPLLSVLAMLPIVTLLSGLTILRWSAARSSIVAFGLALVLGVVVFGLGPLGAVLAMVKGTLLSLFVLLIVWAALFLYSILNRLGAIETIGSAMIGSSQRPAARALLMGWGFSGFIQGFAGFGAPVASVVPLLQVAGFDGVAAAAATMVGHSWAITFGSMGSSYFAIQLVTGIPGEELAPWLGFLFVLPIIFTGFAVLHVLLGWKGVRSGAPLVMGVGGAMAATLWITAVLGAGAVASVLAGMVGCGLLLAIARVGRPRLADGASQGSLRVVAEGKSSIHLALLPYYMLVAITLATQVGLSEATTLPAPVGYHRDFHSADQPGLLASWSMAGGYSPSRRGHDLSQVQDQ
ncbi:MAG: glcA [Chloroflexi bacterium]|nr:glcA [Chloroflexota bacterium]